MKKFLERFLEQLSRHRKLTTYFASLLLIGVASSAIYWPSGPLIVGGLMWLDLFITDLVVTLKMDITGMRRREDVRPGK